MKNLLKEIILIFLLLSTSFFSRAQETSPEDSLNPEKEIFTLVENMPQFVGGEKALFKYFADNVKYPEFERSYNFSGTVFVTFIVETDGSISNIKMLREVLGAPGFSKEAIRVVSAMPNWIPGTQRGMAVPVQFNLPLKWKTEGYPPKWIFIMREGSALLDQGNFEKAIVKFNEALRNSPNQPEILFERAAAKLNSNDKTGACKDWETIIKHSESEKYLREANDFLAEFCKE